jgi:predicted 2-oxoglutarate/Fe(II)-dependent dioxygenase YbiX
MQNIHSNVPNQSNLDHEIANDPFPISILPRAGAKEWWDGKGEDLPLMTMGQEHPSLLVIQNLLTKEQCETLIDCFERNHEKHAEHTGVAFWDGRYIQCHDLMKHEIDATRIMQQIRHLSNLHIISEFAGGEPVFPDSAQLTRWTPGIEMRPHADNLKADGTPNATSHRTYSSILYLNDDYEGGHTYFPGFGVRIKPEAGSLLLFGAGFEYVHGVTMVTKGNRYTYGGWFTDDPHWLDRAANIVI